PLVQRLRRVDSLVALEADQLRVEQAGEGLRDLGLADPGLALEKQGATQLQGEQDRRREAPVREIVGLAEADLQVLDRTESHGAIVDPTCEVKLRLSDRKEASPMYPSRFEYVVPASVGEAVSTLAQHGDEAKVLAGGQSLIPLMKLRF